MRRIPGLVILATAVAGCASKTPEAPKVPLTQSASAASAGTIRAAGETVSGTVVEQIKASQYSYLRLKTPKGEVWAAIPAAQVAIGAHVTLLNAMLMTKFESRSLNRTFDEIYFGTLAAAGAAASGAASADAHTIADVWTRKASLVGKSVTVRGVVVKANDGVMGKNWIHLQDGSGDAAQGSNDITVTSLDRAAVGETVTVTGTVRTNKDFGAGYVYAVIVEDAKIAKK